MSRRTDAYLATSRRRRVALALLLSGFVAACSPSDEGPAGTAASASAAVTSSAPAASASASASAAPPDTWEPPPATPDRWQEKVKWEGSLAEQNALMFEQLEAIHGLTSQQRAELEGLFEESQRMGQGKPAASRHAASPAACRKKLADEKVDYASRENDKICGGRYMAPLFDPQTQKPEDASACIDQFEFPNIPCVYPVTWVRANEAALVCEAMGKRICDAHEWEGACYGSVGEPDYNYGIPSRMKWDKAVERMRVQHNINIHEERRWAYGPKHKKKICATGSRKSKNCGVGWNRCGSNTYPAGHFPACVSPLGVYDIHGNAAEHMNLPLAPEQQASAPDTPYGRTEMKGSWFIFDTVQAHKDHCRWRAPHWHGTKVMNPKSHRNYHLGFRCCKSIKNK